MTMYALSLWRPWPWTFFHGGKRIENRPWPLPDWAKGVPIAMHAAQRFDQLALRDMRAGRFTRQARAVPATEHPTGIVGVFQFSGCFHADDRPLSAKIDPWAFGPYCWEVSDVIELEEPIKCRGFQKLWHVPEDIDERLQLVAPALRG